MEKFLGQHNDARMNLSIILTAIRHGARCSNHLAVENLIKSAEGKLCGARVRDRVKCLSNLKRKGFNVTKIILNSAFFREYFPIYIL